MPTGLLLACAALIVAWVASYWWSPVVRWGARGHGVHVAVRGGMIWITRGGPAEALAGARPVVIVPRFGFLVRRADEAAVYLRQHAAFLRRRLGPTDVEAAGEVARADRMRSLVHDDVVSRVDGPRSEPLAADVAPVVSYSMGLTLERGDAHFATRAADGRIEFGEAVPYAATGIPCWMVATALGFVPAFVGGAGVWRELARRRLGAGRCPNCGYDVRVTPTRCPECGMSPVAT